MTSRGYRPTLAQIRTFVTIAETKHFGTAATKLSISQPSLSQALVALETGLGVQLIERSTRRVIVTPVGETLLPFAKSTLDAADKFLSYAQGAEGTLGGPLSIGIIPTVAPYLLPSMLQILTNDYSELQPRLVEKQTQSLIDRLRDGNIDVAVLAVPSGSHSLVEVPLYDEEFIVVVPEDHPMAGREDLTLEALQDLNLLLLDDGHCLRDQIVDLCRLVNVQPTLTRTAVAQASSLTTVIQCVASGLGATLVPYSALDAETTRPGVATARFASGVNAHRTIGLAYRTSSNRSEEFMKFGDVVKRAYASATNTVPTLSGHLAGT